MATGGAEERDELTPQNVTAERSSVQRAARARDLRAAAERDAEVAKLACL